ncbi:MAG: 16S rRNA (adenine(1518)-N(6)/adenine(1519)-N(6))-dimethyltransferase RsmA [Saccharofermentans sp.]|nr:16S rRNA (adenine(1518)-N(6)/adenine(1519)-N(6))-dimethyltransferase RsmA [Saccharofermentans sp.]
MNREETITYINNHGILPESKFGQNFLCDEDIIEAIVDLVEAGPDDKVLEIGPGIGALTREFVNNGIDITAVEIDKRLAQYLSEEGFNIIVSDYTKLKVEDYEPTKFTTAVSNIPYYVMTPIMIKMMSDLTNCRKMTFMVEEAAIDRIDAKVSTKQYGPLAVISKVYGDFCKEFVVGSGSFVPAPHTTSAVITLTRRNGDTFVVDKAFADFVTKCFANRRKKLTNGVPEAKLALEELCIDSNVRAEALTPEQFKSIYAIINS